MPFAERVGFPTYWTEFGQGPRAALMIHCSLAHSGAWAPMARHLTDVLSMVAFDMPGHGQSGPWDGRDEYQKVTCAIAATFCEGPRDVIAHSFGATVALRLAVERPDLVRSLVLVEPVMFSVAAREDPEVFAAHEARMAVFEAAMAAQDWPVAAEAFTAVWGDGTPWAEEPEAQRRALVKQIHLLGAGAEALYEDPGNLQNEGVLEQVQAPVLLIEGSDSPAIIPAIHAGLAARLPVVERAVIAGARHMAPVTHAAQVSAEVSRFLRGVERETCQF